MVAMTRRRFIGTAASVAAGSMLLPPGMRAALAEPAPRHGSLDDIEHVIFVMQENRSFDQVFGTLNGVRGFDDPRARAGANDHPNRHGGRSAFYQPDPLNPDGYELPFHLDTFRTSTNIPTLNHGWIAQHESWNNGGMDNWIGAHRKADGDTNGPLTMGYYDRRDIPFHFALADAFTVCDMYFCSVLGPTSSNRLYMYTGQIDPDGNEGGPAIITSAYNRDLSWTTYPERLQEAGISWRVYWTDQGNSLPVFKQYRYNDPDVTSPLYQNGIVKRDVSEWADDVANGRLPQVTWLNPPAAQSEHPALSIPGAGSTFMYDVLETLAANPDVWRKTVLFYTFDENDGYFDHVLPPTAPPGTPGEYLTGELPTYAGGITGPIGLGFRVPTIVISPWSQGGWVASETFDHTSLIRFVERRFGVREPNITKWRRQTCGDLTSTLRLRSPDRSFPAFTSPETDYERQEQGMSNPAPTVPQHQTLPRQERRRPPQHSVPGRHSVPSRRRPPGSA